MAVDLAAIRKRVLELSGQHRNSSVQLWKPDEGEYKVRGLPWKSTPDGMPFIERRFYYIGKNMGFLAPSQFGKPDPINDLLRKLYSTGKPEDRLLAKKLQPKMRAYMPVIVRGREADGVLVWAFGKMVYQELLKMFTDEDAGDILDPLNGFDLKVNLAPSPKKVDGRSFMDTTVKPRPKSSPLSEDPELAKKWLDSVPNIDDMYKQKTEKEVEQILNIWLAGGADDDVSSDEGSSRGTKPPATDALDQLANEIQSEVKSDARHKPENLTEAKTEAVAGKGKRGLKAKDGDLGDETPVVKQSLDDAFADLMSDSDS